MTFRPVDMKEITMETRQTLLFLGTTDSSTDMGFANSCAKTVRNYVAYVSVLQIKVRSH